MAVRKKLIREYLRGVYHYPGSYALEIETESEDPWLMGVLKDHEADDWEFRKGLFEGWNAHRDGSLRNYGLEFVSMKPWKLPELEENVRRWAIESRFLGIRYVENAPATSVHVHVNMLHETAETLVSFLTIWYLLEDHMAIWAGRGRGTNLFALPARAAQGVWAHVNGFAVNLAKHKLSAAPSHKYSALNLYPLTYQGSVEIRLLGGTSDPERIIQWVHMIDLIMAAAREHPGAYWMDIAPDDPVAFVNNILGPMAFDNIQPKLILRNYLSLDVNLLSAIPDDALLTEVPLKTPKEKKDTSPPEAAGPTTGDDLGNLLSDSLLVLAPGTDPIVAQEDEYVGY